MYDNIESFYDMNKKYVKKYVCFEYLYTHNKPIT